MSDRRPLIEGLKPKVEIDREVEADFVYRDKGKTAPAGAAQEVKAAAARLTPAGARVPLTTRLNADLAEALKRATLQRKLQKVEPNNVQDILEEALTPWLKTHGYL